MQHDHQRKRLPLFTTAGDEELVGTASRCIAVATFDELRALRHDVGCGRPGALYPIPQTEPGAQLCAIEQRAKHERLSGCSPRQVRTVRSLDGIGLRVNDGLGVDDWRLAS